MNTVRGHRDIIIHLDRQLPEAFWIRIAAKHQEIHVTRIKKHRRHCNKPHYFCHIFVSLLSLFINNIHPLNTKWSVSIIWWRHEMETFSALLAICVGNPPVPSEFPARRPVTRSFDVFFDMRLYQLLSKQSWGWWFETATAPITTSL